MKDFYEQMGASATKEEVHNAIKNLDKGIFPNAFVKVLQDPTDKNYGLIIHADGAGSKSIIAYLYYKETGDAKFFKNSAQDSTVMNIDDMACVGAVDNIILSNIINRNTALITGDAITQIISGYDEFCNILKGYGVKILNGGGETADVGDQVTTCTIDSTCFARIKKDKIISFDKVKPGDVIVGLSSSGKAIYEKQENSGIGSNGLTAARHALLNKKYAKKYPEICCSTLKKSGYCGAFDITDKLPESNLTVGEALISPTRTYLPIIKELIEKNFEILHGIVHNTGGGLQKCIKFGKGLHYIKDNLFKTPAVFNAIQNSGKITMKEMFKVFNMGHRMEIYTSPKDAHIIIETASKYGVEAKIVGKIESFDEEKNRVTIIHNGVSYQY